MQYDFEPAMAALFAHLEAAATLTFDATAADDSAVLTEVSDTDGLFEGLPVFGPGVARGAVIVAVDAQAATITLSEIPAEAGAATFKTGFLKTGRRTMHWERTTEQPAMFLRRTGTTDEAQGDGMIATTIEAEVWLYSQSGADPDAVPDVALSNLDRMIRAAFAPDSEDELFTLGGLVHWCRIEGRSDYSPGDQGPQGISRIPVRITLP